MVGRTPSSQPRRLVEFTRADLCRLLGLLDERLRARGASGGLYVVGGAAVSLALSDRRVTQDIDAVISGQVVRDEAAALAAEEGINPSWLNSKAAGWVPRSLTADEERQATTWSEDEYPGLPSTQPGEPGLHVRLAPPEHLLAMKMVAMRTPDHPDIETLARRLGMEYAAPEAFADVLRRAYPAEDELQDMLNVPHDNVDVEAVRIGVLVCAILERRRAEKRDSPFRRASAAATQRGVSSKGTNRGSFKADVRDEPDVDLGS